MYRGRPVLDYLYWVAVTKHLVHERKEEYQSVSQCMRLIGKTCFGCVAGLRVKETSCGRVSAEDG